MLEFDRNSFKNTDVDQSIAERFESQVALYPNRIAAVDLKDSLTYSALNEQANQIAHAIMERVDTGAKERIAVFMGKNVHYLAAVLGVLKAGHCYVPLDPAFPEGRTKHILEDAAPVLVITTARLNPEFCCNKSYAGEVIILDTISDSLPKSNPEPQSTADDLAYIIYTSGSTGNPKGVMQNHRNTLHGCMRRSHLQKICPSDRFTLFYSCSVMGSVYCIFGALLNGASIYPYDIREEGLLELAEWLTGNQITIYHSVASLFRPFAKIASDYSKGFSVRLVIFGGEKVLTSDVKLARLLFSEDVTFYTGLGSTETGTIRYFPITKSTALNSDIVPIGYPVDGVTVELRGEDDIIVPEGEIGEITVCSRYIALGYWNQPESTSKVFSIHKNDPSIRTYKMGDLAQDVGGELLEHRGRKDFQVKIRGFRVELNEVDSTLQNHPDIEDAIVVAKEVGSEMQLIAYIAKEKNRAPLTVQKLREYLSDKLPYYMVPSTFLELEAIPKTPNGKVDRKNLPEPHPALELDDLPEKEAENEIESKLLEIAMELLNRRSLGTNQNFFDYGGDSLRATQLISRVKDNFHCVLTMREIFEAPDFKALSLLIGSKTKSDQSDTVQISAAPKGAILPLSFAQHRMWMIDQLFGGTAAYNISNTVYLRGSLNDLALEKAINAIVERHDILRTTFTSSRGEDPQQIIKPFKYTKLTNTELKGQDEQSDLAIAKFINAELAKAHSLSQGPLFHPILIKLTENTHILSLVFNHIIYDNIWSSSIFFDELSKLYGYFLDGTDFDSHPNHLPRLDIQFADFTYWERHQVEDSRLDGQLDYWKQQLSALPGPLDLPSDFPKKEQPTLKGSVVSFTIPTELRLAILHYARGHNATVFMVLLAAWQLLLCRYSGQSDIVVGTPSGRRRHTQIEPLLGLFINNLVMRTHIEDSECFDDLIRNVKTMAIDAFSNDEIPFEHLVSELAPARSQGSPPFFQHFFIHRNASNKAWGLPGLDLLPFSSHHGGSKFDLTLSVLEEDNKISGTIEFSSDLFLKSTIVSMAEHYTQLLSSAMEMPKQPVMLLEIKSARENQLLLDTWNNTQLDYPSELSTETLVEQWAKRAPEKEALIYRDTKLSYKELNEKANQLAHFIQKKGLKPDDLVAVCLNRSSELVITLLAVLKSGAAYVPLDPDFPADRLKHMVEDSEAKLFITDSSLSEQFSDVTTEMLFLDEAHETVFSNLEHTQNPLSNASPLNLAYVIYTSGSTGKPKGVQVTRMGLTNFLCSMQKEPGINSDDTLQALTTICFDISALELYLPLISGAKVVISDREASMSPEAIQQSLQDHGVTIMQATPVTWRMLLDNGWKGKSDLVVLCGGEAMGISLAEKLIPASKEVWNVYGPTETTIWSSIQRVKTKEDALTIGHPIANTQMHIFSQAMHLQPIGVPGELMIGGDGLARGYHKREDLTLEKFIKNPLDSSTRLYRTGDLAVRKADGSLAFLGRMDNQVKIRGFRIELGEIETRLAEHPAVKHVAVVAIDEESDMKALAAYYTLENNEEPERSELNAFLKETLPAYMIPSYLCLLDEFPQTPNGKIDRKKLPRPQPNANRSKGDSESTARSDMDYAMIHTWQEVLGLDYITIDDQFFDLGGNSISAVKLVKEMYIHTGVDFSLGQLFSLSTIRGLVDSDKDATESASSIVRLNNSVEGTPTYCLLGLHIYKNLAEQIDSPVFGVFAKREMALISNEEGNGSPQVSIDHLVNSYIDAILRHHQDHTQKDISLVGVSFGGLLALEVAHKLTTHGFRIKELVLLDTYLPITSKRYLKHVPGDFLSLMIQRGPQYILERALQKFKKPKANLQTKNQNNEENIDKNEKLKQLSRYFDLSPNRFELNITLVKASNKNRGIGVRTLPDYGYSQINNGHMNIVTMDTDHLGMLSEKHSAELHMKLTQIKKNTTNAKA